MSQSSPVIGRMVAVNCNSMTALGGEFGQPGRGSCGLQLTLFTVSLAQDGGEVQVRAGGVWGEAKQVLCHLQLFLRWSHDSRRSQGKTRGLQEFPLTYITAVYSNKYGPHCLG